MFCVLPEEGRLSGGLNVVNHCFEPAFNKELRVIKMFEGQELSTWSIAVWLTKYNLVDHNCTQFCHLTRLHIFMDE